ncbi:MAG: hypothetical protein KIT56_06665 [Gammaproteobacteria bacterium]|nr:hypothetical protein [Gammaproteobacteria bacterium]
MTHPNHLIDYSVKNQAESMIGTSAQDVHKKHQSITQDGTVIQQKIENEKAHSRHGSLASDLWNNVDTKDRE